MMQKGSASDARSDCRSWGGPFDASIDIALEAAKFFDLTPAEARQQASEMAKMIANNWKQALRTEGASADEVRIYTDAFEHEALAKTLSLQSTAGGN